MILLLLFPITLMAGFSEIDSNDLYVYRPKQYIRKKRVIKSDQREKLLNKLLDEDKKLLEALKRQERNVIVRRKSNKIMALTRLEGVVLNSILAMNIKPAKFIVKLSDEIEDLEGSELRCLGYSFQKRIPAHCDLLVNGDEEYSVDIDIWDLDGAEGVIADYFYSGEEKVFLTSSFASFLEGVLDVAKDRLNTPFGEVTKNNAKNRVLGGVMGVAKNINDKVVESGEKNLSIAYVNSGKKVLVFFNKSLNLEKSK